MTIVAANTVNGSGGAANHFGQVFLGDVFFNQNSFNAVDLYFGHGTGLFPVNIGKRSILIYAYLHLMYSFPLNTFNCSQNDCIFIGLFYAINVHLMYICCVKTYRYEKNQNQTIHHLPDPGRPYTLPAGVCPHGHRPGCRNLHDRYQQQGDQVDGF